MLAVLLFAATAAQSAPRLPGDLVYLRDIDPGIRQDMRYAGPDNFTGRALPGYRAGECILRRGAALALKRVQSDLSHSNVSLKVYDCYRPARAVAAMAAWSRDPNDDTRHYYPGLKKDRLFALGYIAGRSAHSRGVAVDLTLVPVNAPEPAASTSRGSCAAPAASRMPDSSLDMGTAFDCFDAKSATRSAAISPEQRVNRIMLLEAMARHGFKNYHREWWHFSYAAGDGGSAYDVPIEPR